MLLVILLDGRIMAWENAVLPEKPRVLVVDKENKETKRLLAFLREQDYEVLWAKDGEAGFNILDSESPPEAIISEIKLHRIDGMRLLQMAKARRPDICAVMIATDAEIELAIETMREGAFDFQVKPLNLEKLSLTLERGLSHQRLAGELSELRDQFREKAGFQNLVGISPKMQALFETLRQVSSTNATVLIIGETGTGKDRVAQAVHEASARRDYPFVKLSCGSLAESLVESELFGHEKGAFTGAVSRRPGRFELAEGGTFFLDGVDELPLQTQGKFLRILERGEYEPLGSSVPKKADVRVIAAAKQDLTALVAAGKMREDLCYRLRVVHITIPTLRERKEDIPPLVSSFLKELNVELEANIKGLTRGALKRLMEYDWPGNVRELRNCLETMILLAGKKSYLDENDLPPRLEDAGLRGPEITFAVGKPMHEAERKLILATLQHFGYDKPKTAQALGIGLRTLYRKLKSYGLA